MVKKAIERKQLFADGGLIGLRQPGLVAGAERVLGLLDGGEAAGREEGQNRRAEAGGAVGWNQDRLVEYIGVNLIEDGVCLLYTSRCV